MGWHQPVSDTNNNNNDWWWGSLYMFMTAVFFLVLATISSDCQMKVKCLGTSTVADCNQVETFWK